MPPNAILAEMAATQDREALFATFADHCRALGATGVVYVAPDAVAGPYVLMHTGMPADWIHLYETQQLKTCDPIPGIAFRLGRPERLDDLLRDLPALSESERQFVAAFQSQSGIENGLAIPAFGPLARPGFIGLAQFDPPETLDTLDIPLTSAVAQAFHIRMELLQVGTPPPSLSPREREILSWLIKGKATGDIAGILDIAEPTVATHVKRIYDKLNVHDRASCIAKALAYRYL